MSEGHDGTKGERDAAAAGERDAAAGERDDLRALRARLLRTTDEGRPDAVARRRKSGQRTARENIADLVDDGSFVEYGGLALAAQHQRLPDDELIAASPADGIVCGIGSVNGARFAD